MALELVDHVGGVVALDDTVEIAILERADERFWYVCCSPFVPSANSPEMLFRGRSVPRIVWQLYAALKGRGSDRLHDAETGSYRLFGPHLSRRGSALHRVGDYGVASFLSAFKPEPRPTDPATLRSLLSGPEFTYVFEKMADEINRPRVWCDWREKALRWRRLAKEPRRRALARTEALREELMAAAWHPRRMVAWCLDEDERRELAEMGAR